MFVFSRGLIAQFGDEQITNVSLPPLPRSQLSARHVPSLILPISDIPYTLNGKKVEVAVKKILAGKEVGNKGALANPESLDLFTNIPETKVVAQHSGVSSDPVFFIPPGLVADPPACLPASHLSSREKLKHFQIVILFYFSVALLRNKVKKAHISAHSKLN